jgi:putative oxidoreductase
MNALNRFTDPVYCVMRVIAGLLLAQHGGQLVLGMFGGMPGSENFQSQLGGWIMLIGGFMIAFGLFARLAAFICSGTFAYAYFFIHIAKMATTPMAKFFPIASAGKEFSNHGELAVFYCWVFLFMVFYGPGRWSLDAMFFKKGALAPAPAR